MPWPAGSAGLPEARPPSSSRPGFDHIPTRLARSGSLALLADEKVEFAPIVATGGEPPSEAATPLSRPGSIEIELGGTVIRVTPGTDWQHLRDVLRAVKAAM